MSRGTGRTGVLLYLDVCLLIAFCLLQAPHGTGTVLHEWVGVAFAAVVLAHLVLNWTWIAATVRRVLAAGARRSRVNTLLNAALFVFMTFATFSGLMISQVALPMAGIDPSPAIPWRKVHNQFANLSILMVGLHLGLNWDWIAAAIGRMFRRSSPAAAAVTSIAFSTSANDVPAQRGFPATLGRLAAICVAAAVVSTMCFALVGSGRPLSNTTRRIERTLRPERPRPESLPRQMTVQLLVVGLGAVIGKKLFRLQL